MNNKTFNESEQKQKRKKNGMTFHLLDEKTTKKTE